MRAPMLLAAIAAAGWVSAPAAATSFATPNPMSMKYSDQGAKPATGRSGSAAIEVRALKGLDGNTDLEVTTGQFDTSTAPRGKIDKVQVKIVGPDGGVLQTDNYRKTLTGNGYVNLIYDSLPREQGVQVQANVTGIDPNRTDVVTVGSNVKLRPDIEAVGLQGPARAHVNTSVPFVGTLSETNGDVGARVDCELLVDGAVAGRIAGAWIDAGTSVSCSFNLTFATVGTKALALRAANVVPGDYDAGNNAVSASIEIVEPTQPFNYFQVYGYQRDYLNAYRYGYTYRYPNSPTYSYQYERRYEDTIQQVGASGHFYGPSTLDGTTLTLNHSTDGSPLPSVSLDVSALPNRWGSGDYGCREGYLQSGIRAATCHYGGWAYAYVYLVTGRAAYFERQSDSNGSVWYWNNYYYDYGPRLFNLGTEYTAELRLENALTVRVGSLSTDFPNSYTQPETTGSQCWDYSWSDGVSSHYCYSWQYRDAYKHGYRYQYY